MTLSITRVIPHRVDTRRAKIPDHVYRWPDFPQACNHPCDIALGLRGSASAAAAPEPAPGFNAKTLTGEVFNNKNLLGKVVLIEFWATWCPYCRQDEEPVDQLVMEYAKDGLVVLAVDVAESKKIVKAYLERNPRRAKVVLMEDTNLAAMFAAKRFPLYVALDRDGRVAGEQKGSGGDRALRNLLHRAGLESGAGADEGVELQSSARKTP